MNRLLNNWSLKVTALVLAVILWSHVRGEVNPWEEATFQVALQTDPPRKMVLLNRDEIPATVKIKVRAPRLRLRELKGVTPANPLAISDEPVSLSSELITASLDFTLARRGEQNVPVKAISYDDDLEISSVKPSDVVVQLDQAVEKSVAVRPRLQIAEGYRIEDVSLDRKQIIVSGPAQLVEQVRYARVRLRSGVLKLNHVQAVRAPLTAIDANGQIVNGVQIEPAFCEIRAVLRQEKLSRRVPVAVQIQGAPAKGFHVGAVRVEPSQILLRGSRLALQKISNLPVKVALDNAEQSLTKRVAIALPLGVSAVNGATARINVEILPEREVAELSPKQPDRKSLLSPKPLSSGANPKKTPSPEPPATPLPLPTNAMEDVPVRAE